MVRKMLTDRSLRALKAAPAGKRRIVWDSIIAGLGVRSTDTGHHSFVLVTRYPGSKNPTPKSLGDVGAISLEKARQKAREHLELIQKGLDPKAEEERRRQAELRKQEHASADLFPTVVKTYLKHYEEGRATRKKTRPKETTLLETARLLGIERDSDGKWQVTKGDTRRPAQDAVWGKKRIQDITRRDVVEMLDGIVDRGAPYVGNRTFAAISPLFAWAVRREMIEVSPAVWDKAAEEKRERALSNDELRWFWKATEGLGHPFGPIFRLLALTGQRLREVGAMTEHELEMDKRLWTIPGARTKNRRDHIVPLSDAAIDALEGRVRIESDQRFTFTVTGKTAPSGYANGKEAVEKAMLKLARKEAEERGEDPGKVVIPQWQLHDLRRTVSTKMHEELGIEPHIVEAVLNHVSGARAGVAGVYNRAQYLNQKTAALQAWGRWLLALVEGKKVDNVIPMSRGGA